MLFSVHDGCYLPFTINVIGCSRWRLLRTCTNIIGNIYNDDVHEKEKAYTFFYTVLNCGAISAPILYGFFSQKFSLNMCFLIPVVCLSACLIAITLNKQLIRNFDVMVNIPDKWNIILFIFSMAMLFLVTVFGFYFYVISNKIFPWVLIATLISIFIYISKHKNNKELLAIFLILTFSSIFFVGSLQVGSSITFFLDRAVNKTILSLTIPTSFFTSLDPLFLVLSAPIFLYLWKLLSNKNLEPTVIGKLAIGLLMGAFSFILLLVASKMSFSHLHYETLSIIVFAYLLLGAGEMCLSPSVLSCINTKSPKELKNAVAGSWYFFMSLAAYLGGFIDQISLELNHSYFLLFNFNSFEWAFILTGAIAFFSALLLGCLSKSIRRLMMGDSNKG